MDRTLDFYLAQPYPYTVLPDDEDGGFVIFFPDLPGCMTQVESADEIAPMADEIRILWLETAFELGHAIPLPRDIGEYSGKFVVRLPKSLHRTLAETAEREGVSLNAWVTTLLARGSATAPADGRAVAGTARTANDVPTAGRPSRSRSRSRPALVHP